MTSAPPPVLPAFDGPCVTNVVRALVDRSGGEGTEELAAARQWLPELATSARQVVLLVVDGLGWEQLQSRRALAPALAGGVGGPSTTAVALTSLSTGLPPSVHGVVGYRLHAAGGVLNVLTWRLDGADARTTVPPASLQ